VHGDQYPADPDPGHPGHLRVPADGEHVVAEPGAVHQVPAGGHRRGQQQHADRYARDRVVAERLEAVGHLAGEVVERGVEQTTHDQRHPERRDERVDP